MKLNVINGGKIVLTDENDPLKRQGAFLKDVVGIVSDDPTITLNTNPESIIISYADLSEVNGTTKPTYSALLSYLESEWLRYKFPDKVIVTDPHGTAVKPFAYTDQVVLWKENIDGLPDVSKRIQMPYHYGLHKLYRKTTVKEQLSTFAGGQLLGFNLTANFDYGSVKRFDEWPFMFSPDTETLPQNTICLFKSTVNNVEVYLVGRCEHLEEFGGNRPVNNPHVPLDNQWYMDIIVLYPWDMNYQHHQTDNQPGMNVPIMNIYKYQNAVTGLILGRKYMPNMVTFHCIEWTYNNYISWLTIPEINGQHPFKDTVVTPAEADEYCKISPFYSCFLNFAKSGKLSIDEAWELVTGLYGHADIAFTGVISHPDLPFPILPCSKFSTIEYPYSVWYYKKVINPLSASVHYWSNTAGAWVTTEGLTSISSFEDVFLRITGANPITSSIGVLLAKPEQP